MNLQDKIEEIRQKPEHMRLRYVWGLTAVSLLIIIILWLFSIKSRQDDSLDPVLDSDQENIINQLGEQKQSLQNAAGQMKDAFREVQNQTDENGLAQ